MKRRRRQRQGAGLLVLAALIQLLVLLLCGSLWYFQLTGQAIFTFGYEWMAAETGEMEPDIPKGSLLLLLPAGEEKALPGSAVVTGRENGQGGSLCRILEETQQGYLVKADRATEAMEISQDSVTHRLGKSLPWLGAVWNFLLTIPGAAVVVGLPFIGLVFAVIRHVRRKRQWEETPDLRRKVAKISSHQEDDRREHFVDVTEVYTGSGHRKPYSSPLRRAMGQKEDEEPDEEIPDKFSDLDFNPLIKPSSSSLETVEIPNSPDTLRIFLSGAEAADIPLTEPQQISLKSGRWRIDITIAANEEEGKGAGK